MDDVGNLFARLGKKVLSSTGEHEDNDETPPTIEHKQTT